jgi:hypothetical protein
MNHLIHPKRGSNMFMSLFNLFLATAPIFLLSDDLHKIITDRKRCSYWIIVRAVWLGAVILYAILKFQ